MLPNVETGWQQHEQEVPNQIPKCQKKSQICYLFQSFNTTLVIRIGFEEEKRKKSILICSHGKPHLTFHLTIPRTVQDLSSYIYTNSENVLGITYQQLTNLHKLSFIGSFDLKIWRYWTIWHLLEKNAQKATKLISCFISTPSYLLFEFLEKKPKPLKPTIFHLPSQVFEQFQR